MYEIRDASDRFYILRLVAPVSHEDMTDATRRLREIVRDAVEPLMLLTDLRGAGDLPDDATAELAFVMRMNDRDVRIHVVVALPESGAHALATEAVERARSETRHAVGSLGDARRLLVDHFGPAEDYAFEAYFIETR